MANLDSASKRRSATGIFLLFTIPFEPDGSHTSLDRMNAAYIYAGILPGTGVTIDGEISIKLTMQYDNVMIGSDFANSKWDIL